MMACLVFILSAGSMHMSIRAMDTISRKALGLSLNDPQYKDIVEPTNLPPNVPPAYNPDGTYSYDGENFTTKAYQNEAFRLVLKEANNVARELQLQEKLPITETDLAEIFIASYGSSRVGFKPLGVISTKDYSYCVSIDHKLCYVERAHESQDALNWTEHYKWPLSRLDTNKAYQLATQWMAEAHMDVQGLNRDCEVHVVSDRYWNDPKLGKKTFVPIYEIYWLSLLNKTTGYGEAASVKLFEPTKILVSLRVEDPKYILRPQIVFTNLAELLLNTNKTYPLLHPWHPTLETNYDPN